MNTVMTILYAATHAAVVGLLFTAILLAGHGKFAPRHVRRLMKMQEDNHFVAAMTKHCLHSSVPWPVMTSDGMLVAWVCDECHEERDTFKPPPRKAKPIQVDLLADPPWGVHS